MSVSDGYLQYVLEQLSGLRGLTSKRMFGGVGLYVGGAIFAVMDHEQIFFKVNDDTRADYLALGSKPWQPMPGREKPSQGYYELPPELLDDRDRLTVWATRAAEVARSARPARKTSAAKGKKKASRRTAAAKGTKKTRRRR